MCAENQDSALDVSESAIENCGYPMISRLELRNFRCFETSIINGLKRFNFIVGESGSGKTAFLETIFLLSSGSPQAYFQLRRWRGIAENGQLELTATRDSFESLFRHIFHSADRNSIARISFVDSDRERRALNIYFEDQETLDIPLSKTESAVSITPITFKWDVGNKITNITLEIKDGALRAMGGASFYPLHFISPKNTSSKFDAQLFSQLSRALRSDELQESIGNIFPMIEQLSLEIVGGETLIHAKVEGFPEKIAINELSGGLNKYISIALAIATNRNGVVLIDEIENGFYYRNHRAIIASIAQLCDQYNVQIFASTHSWEFLTAISDVMESRPDDLVLLKTKFEAHQCVISKSEGESAISAIRQDVEVRN